VPDGYREVDYGDVTWQTDIRLEKDTPPLDVASVRSRYRGRKDGHRAARDVVDGKEAGLTQARLPKRAAEIERAEQEKAAQASGDPDDLWASIMTAVPEEWSTPQIDDDFERVTGVDPAQGHGRAHERLPGAPRIHKGERVMFERFTDEGRRAIVPHAR
jgi:hypothetical protein